MKRSARIVPICIDKCLERSTGVLLKGWAGATTTGWGGRAGCRATWSIRAARTDCISRNQLLQMPAAAMAAFHHFSTIAYQSFKAAVAIFTVKFVNRHVSLPESQLRHGCHHNMACYSKLHNDKLRFYCRLLLFLHWRCISGVALPETVVRFLWS